MWGLKVHKIKPIKIKWFEMSDDQLRPIQSDAVVVEQASG